MLLLNLLLALAWLALTGQFTPLNFAAGFILSALLLRLVPHSSETPKYFRRVTNTFTFILFYLWELLLANLRVAASVLSPSMRLSPMVVAIPLKEQSDISITLLANLITLTPGSLSLDVSNDRRVLYVHTMHARDVEQYRREIKALEARVLEVTQ
ncbi:MAG: Na+/H+ antiporter subunit E [Anaerolineales bacterium]|nr:Na+/H+ antiporter subunit E [Anaerolineales bacterium]